MISNPKPGHKTEEKIQAPSVFIAALFTIAKVCKQPKC